MTRWTGLAAVLAVTVCAGAVVGAIGEADPNVDGLGSGFSGPAGTMTVTAATPDPSLAVGPDHVVEAAGGFLAVFDKTGAPIAGPMPVTSLWAGFDRSCAIANDLTSTVLYDREAERWLVSHVAGVWSCVAVSQTPDPAGGYTRYAFPLTAAPVSATLTAWPDAYIAAFERAPGAAAAGGSTVCAYDRSQMLAGLPATQQCFDIDISHVLPADLDGSVQPPAGTPAFLLSLGSDGASLDLRTFHVDWTAPGNSAIGGPTALPVQPWIDPAATSIPQSGRVLLDSGAGRLMRRVVYRAFDDGHAALLANHTVAAGSAAGIRWYEVQIPAGSGSPSIAQQGTFAPNTDDRWMGALAMDAAGGIALGYHASNAGITPGIRYTGRLAVDAPGEMTQGEGTIVDGAGAQTTSAWGRVTALAVDPDDCTFWFAGEYLSSDGSLNWRTRLASFALPACEPVTADDFTITLDPASAIEGQAATVQTTVATSVTAGTPGTVIFTVTGVPAGASVSFSPPSVAAGGSSVLSIDTGSAAAGTYYLDVSGTASGTTHTAVFALTVTTPPPDFTVSIDPAILTIMPGGTATYTVTSQALFGSTQSIALSLSGLPAGATAGFSPATITAGGSSTLTISAPGSTPLGTSLFTVSGTSSTAVHTGTAKLRVLYPFDVRRLANGVPLTGLRGLKNSDQYFVFTVQPGQDSVTFTMAAGSGNADLYVRYGDFPSATTWECRPHLSTNSESCTIYAPPAGEWFVMMRGVTQYSGVSLTGSHTADTTVPALTNGVPVTPLSGSTGQTQFWKLVVPAGQATLTFKISGGTGDADLYVRFGSKPTTGNYTCRPFLNGNNETCTFTNPAAGVYYVMVRGFTSFTGVTLVGTYAGDTTPLLVNAVPVTGISGATGSQKFWRLAVPAGVTSVTFKIVGGSGDADLYVRRGAKPTTSAWDCRPYLNGNNETCSLSNSGNTSYYVMIRGFTAFSGVTLTGSY